MKALLIKVNFATGKRAGGGVNHKDPNLRGHPGWQDVEAGTEVRIVVDGNADKYRGIEGVKVLESEAEIDAAVAVYEKTTYKIDSEPMLNASIASKAIDISDIAPTDSLQDQTKKLYERGALGITEIVRKPPKAAEVGE